jgi:hypothetical protein
MISGSATRRAAVAAAPSPDAIASSTLRMNVRTRERRAVLTSVRRAILRAIFLAEAVFAILGSDINLSAHYPMTMRKAAVYAQRQVKGQARKAILVQAIMPFLQSWQAAFH